MPTLVIQIANNLDDTSVNRFFSSFSTTTAALIAGNDGNPGLDAAFRWVGVNIPQGSTINNAFITFIPFNASQPGSPVTTIRGADEDNSARITSFADFDGRARTAASVAFSPGAWTPGVPVNSPDITTVIQEIVDRPSFAESALQLFWADDSSPSPDFRRAIAHDSAPLSSAELTVDFTPPPVVSGQVSAAQRDLLLL